MRGLPHAAAVVEPDRVGARGAEQAGTGQVPLDQGVRGFERGQIGRGGSRPAFLGNGGTPI